MRNRAAWNSTYGFYLAAIGSSFGLGNLWRFPYVVGSNGGGAFVLLYIFMALIIGLPLLIAELILGRSTKRSGIMAFRMAGASSKTSTESELRAFKVGSGQASTWAWFGRMAVLGSILLLSYYVVISGWVLHYLIQFIWEILQREPFRANHVFKTLMDNGSLQYSLAMIHLLTAGFVVAKGVREGIEKAVGYIVPLFAILLVYLAVKSLTLPGSGDALRFLFYPNFSDFKISSLIYVIGHIFFTLSIGMASLTAFGSYLSDGVHIPTTGFRVTIMDITISLFSGIIIFPIVFSGNVESGSDPSLLFKSVPLLFEYIGVGKLFGVAFFLCLYLASLGASIGLLEAGVSNLMDQKRFPRIQASYVMVAVVGVLALFPALSSSFFSNISYQGKGLLEIMDSTLINGVIPVVALGISILVATKMSSMVRRKEFIDPNDTSSVKLYWQWVFMLRWVVPVIIVVALGIHWTDLIRDFLRP